jgi:hypothetical protein
MSNLCKVGINKFVILSFWYNMQALYIVTKNNVTGTTQSYPIKLLMKKFFLNSKVLLGLHLIRAGWTLLFVEGLVRYWYLQMKEIIFALASSSTMFCSVLFQSFALRMVVIGGVSMNAFRWLASKYFCPLFLLVSAGTSSVKVSKCNPNGTLIFSFFCSC